MIENLCCKIRVGRRPKKMDQDHITVDGVSFIYLESQAVSSEHLSLALSGDDFVITDTSRNGTKLRFGSEERQVN